MESCQDTLYVKVREEKLIYIDLTKETQQKEHIQKNKFIKINDYFKNHLNKDKSPSMCKSQNNFYIIGNNFNEKHIE